MPLSLCARRPESCVCDALPERQVNLEVRDGQPILITYIITYIALGRAGVDTPRGTYSTGGTFRADRMTSRSVPDATRPYDLSNVPFTQYYRESGYTIHGTYWHDNYGSRESQGCVNLTWTDSAYLFGLTKPDVPGDSNQKWARGEPATPVVIVD